ncbi:hypothetical protein SDC9_212601 [bioreactor metagenome]|uniref:Uncharacterized protein n=1 Tax=bioreactor metagenome TaxID=1076179 RepID=A0A645JZM0_9ZZZZ
MRIYHLSVWEKVIQPDARSCFIPGQVMVTRSLSGMVHLFGKGARLAKMLSSAAGRPSRMTPGSVILRRFKRVHILQPIWKLKITSSLLRWLRPRMIISWVAQRNALRTLKEPISAKALASAVHQYSYRGLSWHLKPLLPPEPWLLRIQKKSG